jgi:DNA-3-methyladenine glycosylase II
MMLDHPAWTPFGDGHAARACRSGDAIWSVVVDHEAAGGHRIDAVRLTGAHPAPVVDVVDPSALDVDVDDTLAGPLRTGGLVARVRNPDLWEALGTSIVRQVIRATQARKLHGAFCRAHGEQVDTPAGPALLFPAAETVLALSDAEFERLGMKFFRNGLRSAAEAYLKFGEDWSALPPGQLVAELLTVRRIGPWTAGATVADYTNDFTLYPFSDLAVRTWATRLAPSVSWPEGEREFAKVWRSVAGKHLSDLTVLTLAWGVRNAGFVT